MIRDKKPKMRLGRVIFGLFFVIIGVFGLLGNAILPAEMAYADPAESSTTENRDTNTGGEDGNSGNSATASSVGEDGCKNALGAIGWLVCPTTGAIANAVDWLYDKIQEFLVINPVSSEAGSPIYEIWKYCRGVTNVVFIIFLLVVIYSQITGLGITNYGIKKALPKLIVVAILVNLSFLICSILVDASNIVGSSLRGLFTSVEETALAGMQAEGGGMSATELAVAESDMFNAIVGGSALAIGGAVIAFETGAIWMMIPVVLGAIVAVATGLITIALRQAVVALLIMISPLAIVAYMLPNTENLFTKWRKLLTQMLVFYPMFSLLFGASSLAGFAIIASASDGFGLLLGTAVQIFPLFFSWKLMQMSGTFLGTINTKMRELGARPVGGARTWADSMRMASKQKHLASGRPVTPSLRLMQFASNRRVAREAETAENAELAKNRGLAYRARLNYDGKGIPTKRGEESYENQARNMEYQRVVERDKNNMNKGLGQLTAVAGASSAKKARLDALDTRNVLASDYLKFEQARGEKIDADNAEGFYKRTEAAMNWHMDREHGFEYEKDANGEYVLKDGDRINLGRKREYRLHMEPGSADAIEAATRYSTMSEIMEGNAADIQFAAAGAAHAYDTQKKIIETKYQKYFELLPPTKDVEYRLGELTTMKNASDYIDTIIPGLRVLNQRGDTDLVRKQMENVLNSEKGIELGTHASQALASFLMFEVKDSDPFLRRFGKYINLETAQVYNKNNRQNARLSLDEYVTGEYEDWEFDDPNQKVVRKSKRGIVPLVLGTSLDSVERTAYSNLDDILKNAYTDGNGNLDVRKYLSKREEIETAMTPAFITANMKYLAGSEQIQNAVSFLTGIGGDGKTRWEGEGDLAGDAEYAEKYFRKRAMQYLKDQTPMQILGMRSDYRDAMMEHLVEEYFENNPDERTAFEAEKARIQTLYGDEDAATAEEKRKDDLKKIKMDLAGRQMREVLGKSGKLEQIYRTRRSGAANNAKDWLREWVNLDNENALKTEVDYYKEERKREWREEMQRRKEADPDFNYEEPHRVYDESDQLGFQAEMSNINDEYKDGDVKTYFEITRDKLDDWFPDDFIVWSYEKYYEKNKYIDTDDLYSWVYEILADLDNYPGNRDNK